MLKIFIPTMEYDFDIIFRLVCGAALGLQLCTSVISVNKLTIFNGDRDLPLYQRRTSGK
jgi:hypothetical protein